MSDTESAKELIQMCRTGKLYEIERWISEGRSIDISTASRRRKPESLLELAVETGFHSLVDLIAKNEQCADAKTAAMCAAACCASAWNRSPMSAIGRSHGGFFRFSAVIELTAVTLFALNLVGTLMQQPAHLRQASNPASNTSGVL